MPRCPACFAPMTRVDDNGIKLTTCPNCFGTWIQRIALLRSARQMAAEAASRTPEDVLAAQQEITELAATVVESDSRKTRRCTACSVDMVKDRIHPMIPINMDRCPKCDGIWLDVGEFLLIRKLFVELQNTTDPELIARRDKLAMAMLQWEGRTRGLEVAAEESNEIAGGMDMLSRILRRV